MTEYYKLEYYRKRVPSGRQEHIYFLIHEGELKIVDDDRGFILNSKLEKIEEKEMKRILKSKNKGDITH
jgi:hypothetical protein